MNNTRAYKPWKPSHVNKLMRIAKKSPSQMAAAKIAAPLLKRTPAACQTRISYLKRKTKETTETITTTSINQMELRVKITGFRFEGSELVLSLSPNL